MPYAFANNFHGYYCPVIEVSPMRDDVIYTPAGLGVVTSKAGFRIHPVTGRGDFHSGVDLAANLNDRVYNLLDGIVTRGWLAWCFRCGGGNLPSISEYTHNLRAFKCLFGGAWAMG